MTFSKTLIEQLEKLIAGESIPYSSIRHDLAVELQSEGLLSVKANGSRRTLRAINSTALRHFLESRYEEFRGVAALNQDNPTRSSQASVTGNSKLVSVRSCPGFPVNSYEPIHCRLNGDDLVINPSKGTFLFVTDWEQFEVPSNVIIVGVENMENFRLVKRQRSFFEKELLCKLSTSYANAQLLFVSRYPQSTDLRRWLESIPNQYVHFGDFDLAGINIFLTEFYQYLGDRASFIIPSDIESRLRGGSIERYNDQYARFMSLTSDIKEIKMLIYMINKYHRAYDQEGYIE